MIHTWAVTHEGDIREGVPISSLSEPEFLWYWVDFDRPTDEEVKLLSTRFHLHPLAVEDCLHLLQRPKLDHYGEVHFFVLHVLKADTLAFDELDMFLSKQFLVTFHLNEVPELKAAVSKWLEAPGAALQGSVYAAHTVIDQVVDNYFPVVFKIEDELFDLENNKETHTDNKMMDLVFEIRGRLIKLRRTVFPMRDLLYRVVNSERIHGVEPFRAYFTDIYDHLLKLSDIIESNKDLTADMRDSYLSYNSYRMNTIMKTLTVITTIFMPLTFLAGIYGMNFKVMPELNLRYGYFAVLAVMAAVGLGMFAWFKRKGWFE
ncbi:magnesium/cobalt transporter CorA [Paenibacillus thermotolerans]|uniref:magnesium/cobalt transporter CorA n=1 Tax=Paenibacillus thermotolerans TaxID=3027807 RepID=UPI002367A615|nr:MULTISPECIES: magnesium/cobalt transporter CorA [unclassified Paenibacillus]